MKIINLTPHVITVFNGDNTVEFPSKGIARAEQELVQTDSINGIPLFQITFGAPVDLPEPQEGTFYVVSAITAQAAQKVGRITSDLLLPAKLVRDESGRIVGCEGFSTL